MPQSLDVVQLRQFYASPLGQLVASAVGAALKKFWPELGDDALLGIGYATPYLAPYLQQENSKALVVAGMPVTQGAIYWPSGRENRTVLMDEGQMPFGSNWLNRVMLVHGLENTDIEREMLEEIWRVMAPGGRMLVVVPNRRGLWAGSPKSPFAHGKPYSASQLKQAVCEQLFTHIHTSSALFFLPSERKSMLKAAPWMSWLCEKLFPAFGGVWVMEVEKQIYAGIREPVRAATRRIYAPAAAVVSQKIGG